MSDQVVQDTFEDDGLRTEPTADRSCYLRKYRATKRAENPEKYTKRESDRVIRWRAKNPDKARAGYCRSNNSESGIRRQERHNKKHPDARYERSRKSALKRRYNITPEQWDAMFAAQGFACANHGCRTLDPGHKRGWHTDHCHRTSKLRAILCRSCNKALGMVKDSPAALRGLADYLEHHASVGGDLCLPQ